MANVMFKRGVQDEIAKYLLTASTDIAQDATEGTFYLTTDTDRLYIGRKDRDSDRVIAVPVNQGVINVTSVSDLPGEDNAYPGQFYYITDNNILCVYSGTGATGHWVQINACPDTHVDEQTVVAKSENSIIEIEDKLYLSDGKNLLNKTQFEGTNGLNVNFEDIYKTASPAFHSNITYYRKNANNTYEVASVNESSFNSGKNLYVKGGYKLVLTPPQYNFSADVAIDEAGNGSIATLTLTNAKVNEDGEVVDQKVSFSAGNGIVLTKGEEGQGDIIIGLASETAGSMSLKSVDFINHVEKNNESEVVNAEGFDLRLTDQNNKRITSATKLDPVIKLGDNDENYHFVNGVANLDVYTKDEVDQKITEFNAMTYKSVESFEYIMALPSENVKVRQGDVYMLASGTDIYVVEHIASTKGDNKDAVVARPGDLFIASGEENEDGFIEEPKWSYVPSGNDIDTTYTFSAIDNGTGFEITNNATNKKIGKFDINVDEAHLLINANSKDGNLDSVVEIAHKEIHDFGQDENDEDILVSDASEEDENQPDKMSKGEEYEITVPTVFYDKAGHVAEVKTKTYKVVDTRIAEVVHSASTNENKDTTTISTKVSDDSGKFVTGDIIFTSGSLKLNDSKTKKTVKVIESGEVVEKEIDVPQVEVNIEWGTF